LKREGTLKNYSKIYWLFKQVNEAEELFKKATNGFKFWGAQRTWLKRLLKGRSFSIIASTGIGKTTFGVFMSLYFAIKGKKSYLVLPTTTLVRQAIERLQKFQENLGSKISVAYYHAKLKNKEELKKKIKGGDFQILITSSQFLTRNFELLADKKFDFIFVDDVDAFLKASKNIDKILLLLGFTRKIIDVGYKLLNLKINAEKNKRVIEKLENLVKTLKLNHKLGCLIVSSATGRVKGRKVKI